MTTKATFDAATLADAVQKASRVAPTKGAAFDQAAGLLMEVDTNTSTVVLKSTNLDVSYRQVLTATDCKGDPAKWRISAPILTGLVTQLPLGQGNPITFIDKGDKSIRITSGQMVVKLSMYEGDFPSIPAFDQENMSEANDFAQKVQQVAWACENDKNGLMSGVHIDGESLIGCNRYVAAIVPCQVPIAKPVTVPLWAVSGILSKASDVRVSAEEKTLNISLDAETQMTTKIYEGDYPNVKALIRPDHLGTIEIPKVKFVETLNRMMVVARTERLPMVKMTINCTGLIKMITLDMDVPDVGRIQDTIDIGGEYDDLFELMLTPQLMTQAIDAAKDDMVVLQFGGSDPAKSPYLPIRISDSKGYQALITPRRP